MYDYTQFSTKISELDATFIEFQKAGIFSTLHIQFDQPEPEKWQSKSLNDIP